jgi:phosphoserine phosphatase RsbU/P
MVAAIEPLLREQLIERRHKLENAVSVFHRPSELEQLIEEVDAALERMNMGTYGLCEVCHDPIEPERLLADPLTRVCIGDLSPAEQRALEEDLELAAQIQSKLLPSRSQSIDGWEASYHYQPAGAVSGDYCDLIVGEDRSLHFVLGDVSGKGVAASMLMAHLNAMFRTLISVNLPLEQMVERASRVFCESTLPTQYATLAYGKASPDGTVEICNAGHLPPLLVQKEKVTAVDATGLPVGVFCTETFSVRKFQMEKGDSLFLYTDGFSERSDADGREFGSDRLSSLLYQNRGLTADGLIELSRRELKAFANGGSPFDDLTLMAIQRNA